jgi:hypothetical protein
MHQKKEKATRKLKLPLNQHASRQPFTTVPGRASLVKRTLARRRLCGAGKKDKILFYLEYVVYLHIQPLHQGDVHGRFV